MSDRLEERKDFTADVKAKVPEATQLAEVRGTGSLLCFCCEHLRRSTSRLLLPDAAVP
jgi:hypothetical protein